MATFQDNSTYADKLKTLFSEQTFGLTERQERLLGYIALSDAGITTEKNLENKLKAYYSVAKKSSISNDLNVLKKKGLIETAYGWGHNEYSVCDRLFMKVALNAMLYYPDLPPKLPQNYTSDRIRAIEHLFRGEEDMLKKMFSTPGFTAMECTYALLPVMAEKAFEAIFRSLKTSDIGILIRLRLMEDEAQMALSPDVISELDCFTRAYVPEKHLAEAEIEIDSYRWIACGKWTMPDEKLAAKDYVSTAISGIRMLYIGNYVEAVAAIEKALKIKKSLSSKITTHFTSPLLTYYLAAAYVLSGDDKSKKKLSGFLKKSPEGSQFGAAIFLAAKGLGYEDKKICDMIPKQEKMFPETAALMFAIDRQFGTDFIIHPVSESKMSILRHETGIGVNADEAKSLEETFGGPSIISRIHFKQPWELDLDTIGSLIDKNTPSKSGKEQTNRLIYIVEPQGHITIKEQGILKSGRWSAGKNAALSSLCTGIYDAVADEMDKAVLNKIRYRLVLNIDSLFPLLIGCDRVFLDRYDEANRISISSEVPFISLEKDIKKGIFVFSTNVPKVRYFNEFLLETVKKVSTRQYSVIKISQPQKQLLEQIFSKKPEYPETAEKALATLIPRLEKIIEVHSEYFSTASAIEETTGNPVIHIRIVPKPESFALSLYVRPLDGGETVELPANGDAVIFDSADGKRWKVRRDLKAERANLKALTEGIDFDSMDCDESDYFPTVPQLLSLIESVKGMTDICVVEWPEGRSLKVIGKIEQSAININVISNESWFEVEGNAVTTDGREFSLDQIMAALSAGGYSDGYLKLGEDEYAALSDSLAKYMKRMESLGQMQKGNEKVPVFQVGLLADMIRKSGVNAEVDKKYTKALKRMKEAETIVPEVPSGLKAELRDYQLDGFQWMCRLDHWGAGACLADDMGLGKTVQAIAFLLHKASAGPSLVVAPTSVIMNWQRELEKFAPALKPVVINEADDRKAAIETAGAYDIVLMTYGLMAKEKDEISTVKWNVVCLDEAHTIKNKETKMSDAAMSINAESRIILTGTPVQNYLGELWNLFQFINPGLLGTFEQFSSKFIAPIANGDRDRQSQLKRIIQPFMLRRTKSEVVEELPEKTDITRLIELSPAETVIYETMREDAKARLESEGKVNVNALAAITLLREAACAMPLVRKGWKDEPTKVSALMELVQDIVSGGNSVLVFSQFTGFLDIVSSALTSAGVSHFYLNGATPIKRRQEMVSEFQHGARPVFLISLKAGGLGLNLTGANYVIHLDPWWNPAIEQQATDRAYRIGQRQNVTVYHFIAKGTIEEKILRLHKVKQNLADNILEGTSQAHSLTLDELRELLDN